MRFGKEMEDDRVCECRLRRSAGGEDGWSRWPAVLDDRSGVAAVKRREGGRDDDASSVDDKLAGELILDDSVGIALWDGKRGTPERRFRAGDGWGETTDDIPERGLAPKENEVNRCRVASAFSSP